jgi:hypothetical protein
VSPRSAASSIALRLRPGRDRAIGERKAAGGFARRPVVKGQGSCPGFHGKA